MTQAPAKNFGPFSTMQTKASAFKLNVDVIISCSFGDATLIANQPTTRLMFARDKHQDAGSTFGRFWGELAALKPLRPVQPWHFVWDRVSYDTI